MSNCENCITFSESFKIRFKGDNSIEIQQLFGCILGIEEAYKACLCAQYHAPSAIPTSREWKVRISHYDPKNEGWGS